MRTIIAISEDKIKELSYICQKKHISRAEAIRQSIDLYLQNIRISNDADAFGLWKTKNIDALGYQNKLRDEWK